MTVKHVVLSAVTALLLGFGAARAEAQYSPEYTNCYGRAHGTVQQSMCAQTELAKQDARLNKAYQSLMHQNAAAPGKQTALRAEERTWLKKRDYDCNLGREVTDEGCVLQKTADRADVLEHQLKF